MGIESVGGVVLLLSIMFVIITMTVVYGMQRKYNRENERNEEEI